MTVIHTKLLRQVATFADMFFIESLELFNNLKRKSSRENSIFASEVRVDLFDFDIGGFKSSSYFGWVFITKSSQREWVGKYLKIAKR